MRSIWNTNKMVYQRHSLSYQFNEKSTKFNGRCSDKIIIDTLELYDRERETHIYSQASVNNRLHFQTCP